jgi:predicted O-linked N-acetylglucosamine transferase (SPINDLY family)
MILMKTKLTAKAFQDKLKQAIELQNAGNYDASRHLFLDLLKIDSKNSAVLYSLGAIESTCKNFDIAEQYIKKLLSLSPKFALGHLAKSIIHSHKGQYEAALGSVQQALSIDPQLKAAQTHLEMVRVLHQTNAEPTNSIQAEVLELTSKGVGLQNSGDNKGAEQLLMQALELDPKNFTALYTLGIIHLAYSSAEQSLSYFDLAIRYHPQIAPSYHAKGKLLTDLGRYSEALECYKLGIQIDPKHVGIYQNIAALMQFLNQHKEALTILVQGCENVPDCVPLLESQALLLTQFKEFKLAADIFKRILELDPQNPKANSQLMLCMVHNCEWDEFNAVQERIINGVKNNSLVCSPLTFMGISGDVKLVKQATQGYVNEKFKSSPPPLWSGERYQHTRKRVAFLSSDFRTHPVGYLFISLIEKANKEEFELIGISLGVNDQSDLWRRYRCAFEHFLDCQTKTSSEIAKLLRALEVDIAIDLSGHTEGERLEVLAHRPCPVQMTYLGFPGTLCLPFVDYLVIDPVTVPLEVRDSFSEQILELKHCYLPRDNSVKPSHEPLPRAQYGLPEQGFVFCSFNHNFKVTPSMFAIWMKLLINVPNSVLWLMKLTKEAQGNLLRSAAKHGVSEERIVFATRVPQIEDHLARYKHVDLFLDTYPYNGHTTVGDSLLCGVPVVTLRGTSFASRVASSLLSDVDLMENVCETAETYYTRALELAQSPEELARSKAKLHLALTHSWPRSDEEQSREFFDTLKKIL